MIKRELENSFLEAAKVYPVIAILGPRQSGKKNIKKSQLA